MMANPGPGRHRDEVIDLANERGWTRQTERTSHGAISDEFRRGGVTLTLFWSRSVLTDYHWNGGIVSGPDGLRQVWRISKPDGVLDLLRR